MLIEASPVDAEAPELETLVAHVLDYSEEHLAVNVVRSAYLLKRLPDANNAAKWDQVLTAARPLRLRYPNLLTANYRNSLASGTAPHLGVLITHACW
jgi:hypothetical protein